MSFLFTRPFYVAFGAAGFGLDYVAHYLMAANGSGFSTDAVIATGKLLTGWNDTFLATGQFFPFSIGVVAHSMFLFAFVLLAIRGK